MEQEFARLEALRAELIDTISQIGASGLGAAEKANRLVVQLTRDHQEAANALGEVQFSLKLEEQTALLTGPRLEHRRQHGV